MTSAPGPPCRAHWQTWHGTVQGRDSGSCGCLILAGCGGWYADKRPFIPGGSQLGFCAIILLSVIISGKPDLQTAHLGTFLSMLLFCLQCHDRSVHFNKLLNWDELLELLVGYERHKNNKTGLIHTRDCSIWNIINRLIQLSQSGINHECATYMRGKVINQRASLSWRGLHWSWEGGLNTQQTVTEEVEKSRWSQRTREGWEVLLARYVETGGKEDRYHHVLGGQNKVCRKRARVSILGI